MTREQAIKHLEVIKDDCALVGDIRALDMAISALSTDGEYIKKEDALSFLNDLFGEMETVSFDDTVKCLNGLPTYSFPDSAQNKGDLISRQAVEKLVWECLRKETDENIAFYEHFLELPTYSFPNSADDKTMEWIYEGDEISGVFKCSKCGIESENMDFEHFHFCPNCGRKAVNK